MSSNTTTTTTKTNNNNLLSPFDPNQTTNNKTKVINISNEAEDNKESTDYNNIDVLDLDFVNEEEEVDI